MSSFVAYLRVSTQRQGRSGLGLEAQRKAVADFLAGGSWRHVAELVEVESGARDARPRLAEALALCRLHGATLVIAKLDRLSRDAAFLLNLQKAGVRFVAADMPEANELVELVVGIMAVVAQAERKMISARTKAALAAAKAWGVRLGNPANLRNQQVGAERAAPYERPSTRETEANGTGEAPKDGIGAPLSKSLLPGHPVRLAGRLAGARHLIDTACQPAEHLPDRIRDLMCHLGHRLHGDILRVSRRARALEGITPKHSFRSRRHRWALVVC
nr:recombinase family protein [Methylobacterium sp. Leaf122]